MARRPREDAPGTVHHVMVRGIERRTIFYDDEDRADFVRRLSLLVPELGFRCFAWALMPNHVHLVLRSGAVRISRLMARIGTGYVGRFNARHRRVGHLFQNRFRSRIAVDDADLMGLVLYVTRNPIEAGIVAPVALEDFRWCGLGALLGQRRPMPFEAVRETLRLFDDQPARARVRLQAHLRAPARDATSAPLLSAAPAPSPAVRRPPEALEVVVRSECTRFGVPLGAVRSRSRARVVSAARREIARRAAWELGLSGAEIARALGISEGAVSQALAKRESPG